MKRYQILAIIDKVISCSNLTLAIESTNFKRIKQMEEELSFEILETLENSKVVKAEE